jgi:NADPH:quinone reductase
MRAMLVHQFGGPEVITPGDVPVPTPGPHQVLVKVMATGLNPVDYKIRRAPRYKDRKMPIILGADVCGSVETLGPGAQDFKLGDVIYGMANLMADGGYAQYCLLDTRNCVLKPKSLTAIQTAALPVAALTAYQSLHDRARIKPGQTILIHAGAGGVGHFAIQLAKAHGCRVLTTASRSESIAMVKSLGADEIIDYKTQDVIQTTLALTNGQGAHAVMDYAGGKAFEQSLDCVAPAGHIVTIVGDPCTGIPEKLFRKNATLHFEFVAAGVVYGYDIAKHKATLTGLNNMIDAGRLKPHVSKVLKLEDAPEAHRLLESGRTLGKMVLDLAN